MKRLILHCIVAALTFISGIAVSYSYLAAHRPVTPPEEVAPAPPSAARISGEPTDVEARGGLAATGAESPSGDIIVEHREFEDRSPEIWLRSKENPSEEELLYASERDARALVSPDERWIIVNNYYGSDVSEVLLFKRQHGLKYAEEKSARITEKAWGLLGKELGFSDKELDHVYIEGILWSDNSSAVLLKLWGHGAHSYLEPSTCVYSLRTGSPTLSLEAMNDGALQSTRQDEP